MKGIIFNVFQQLVEEKFGMEMWEEILEKSNPASGGAYTSADTYDDGELFGLVGELSTKTNTSVNDLVYVFGEYTLGELAKLYPVFFENKDLRSFLLSVHDVVHVEVKKLYPDAGLPHFSYEGDDPDSLTMIYRSERNLCRLADGLIAGAAKHFNKSIENQHTKCCLKGDDHCRIELQFKS